MQLSGILLLAGATLLGCAKGEAKSTVADVAGGDASPSVHTVTYYSGTAQITLLQSGQTSTEQGILVRTVDSDAGTITEVMCGKDPGKPAFLSPVYMRVQGSSLTISDSTDFQHPHVLSGTGTVSGPAWSWTYLTFNMSYTTTQGAYSIIDANFVLPGQGSIIARKQIFDGQGTPVELYDVTMTAIDEAAYLSTSASMGCPSN